MKNNKILSDEELLEISGGLNFLQNSKFNFPISSIVCAYAAPLPFPLWKLIKKSTEK